MKKIILISFIFCFYLANAQIKVIPSIKLGINNSSVSYLKYSELKQYFYIGAFAIIFNICLC